MVKCYVVIYFLRRKLYFIENLDVDCRFIKVKVKNQKVCPEWHTGSGGKTWLFMDEINIL